MATPTAHPEKITHAFSVLNAAGIDDSNKAVTSPSGTATSTRHPEKITHAVNALNNAGLGDSSSSHHSSHSVSKTLIIIGAVIGGVLLLAFVISVVVVLRQRRKRRLGAYNTVGRSVDGGNMSEQQLHQQQPGGNNPALGAAPGPGMRGFLMPAWRSKGKDAELGPQGERALRGGTSMDLGSRASSMDRGRDRDVFNADHDAEEESERDDMLVGGRKIAERNFESGYDAVDTGYDGVQGDKRSGMGA